MVRVVVMVNLHESILHCSTTISGSELAVCVGPDSPQAPTLLHHESGVLARGNGYGVARHDPELLLFGRRSVPELTEVVTTRGQNIAVICQHQAELVTDSDGFRVASEDLFEPLTVPQPLSRTPQHLHRVRGTPCC